MNRADRIHVQIRSIIQFNSTELHVREKLQTDMKSNLNISKQNIQVYDVIMPHRLQCGAQSIHSTTRNLQHAPQPCVCAHVCV